MTRGMSASVDPARWRAHAEQFGLHVTRDDLGQLLTASAHDWGARTLCEVTGQALTLQRTADVVARAPRDDLVMAVQVEGRSRVRQGAPDVALSPGDIALYSGLRPYQRSLSDGFRTVVVTLSATEVGGGSAVLDRFAGQCLSGSRGLGRVPPRHLVELQREANNITTGHDSITHALAVLLDTATRERACSDSIASGSPGARGMRIAQIRWHAERFIDAHICDAGLGPREVAAAVFVSLRTHGRDQRVGRRLPVRLRMNPCTPSKG